MALFTRTIGPKKQKIRCVQADISLGLMHQWGIICSKGDD